MRWSSTRPTWPARRAPAPADDFHRFSRAEREAAVTPPPSRGRTKSAAADASHEPPAAPIAFRAPRSPGQRAAAGHRARDPGRHRSHEADERVPFEHFAGASERPRTAVLPLALMLLVGLLIGFGGGYVVRGRQPAAPVASIRRTPSAPATRTGARAGRARRQFRGSRRPPAAVAATDRRRDIRARGRAAAGDAGWGGAIGHAGRAVHARRAPA